MLSSGTVSVRAVVARHDDSMPRYLAIPERAIRGWRLSSTTMVEGTINGIDIARRSLKRWDSERWFMDLPERLCQTVGIETGDQVEVVIQVAPTELPAELEETLAESSDARSCWEAMSASQQRMVREHVMAGKRPETRLRRARRAVGIEQ